MWGPMRQPARVEYDCDGADAEVPFASEDTGLAVKRNDFVIVD